MEKKTFELRESQATMKVNIKASDKAPDFKGQVNIGGTIYDIAFWEGKQKSGWYSGKVSTPWAKPEPMKHPEPSTIEDNIDPNDLPF